MRKKITLLLLSVFMVGLGSMWLFFEFSEYSYEYEYTVPNVTYKTITNSYAADDVDQIRVDSGATIVIDEKQVGVKVDLTYITEITKIEGYSYIYTYDCVFIEGTTTCDDAQSEKALVVGYRWLGDKYRMKTVLDITVNELKNKNLINVNLLYKPIIVITLNQKNSKLIIGN